MVKYQLEDPTLHCLSSFLVIGQHLLLLFLVIDQNLLLFLLSFAETSLKIPLMTLRLLTN